MKEGKSYIKDTDDFLDKLKDLGEIPEGAILVTADVVGLYPSIPHTEGLEVLRKQYDKFLHKKVPTEQNGFYAVHLLPIEALETLRVFW